MVHQNFETGPLMTHGSQFTHPCRNVILIVYISNSWVVCAISPVKASSTLNLFASSLHEMVYIKSILIQMNLLQLSHLKRTPQQTLYSQFQEGKLNQERPRLQFNNTVKRNMNKIDIYLPEYLARESKRQSWLEESYQT